MLVGARTVQVLWWQPQPLRFRPGPPSTPGSSNGETTVSEKPPYRLVILGAGFSVPAGLPLASDLWTLVLEEVSSNETSEFHLRRDLEWYKEYRRARFGGELSDEEVDIEDFVAALDIEHFLGLRGSDTWSDAGNQTQLIIRSAIANILIRRQQRMTAAQWAPYERFASRLAAGDRVITFNYDTILEEACDRVGTPYRLCAYRYKKVCEDGNGTLADSDEVVICKAHGSVDWFSRRFYERYQSIRRAGKLEPIVTNLIFDFPDEFGVEPLVGEPYPTDEPMRELYRAKLLVQRDALDNLPTPFLIAPSASKIVWINPLLSYWRAFKWAGRTNSQCAVVGFSFPAHDEYISLALVEAIRAFQNANQCWDHFDETRLKIVELKTSEPERHEWMAHLRFVDWSRTRVYWDGFNEAIVDEILESSTRRVSQSRPKSLGQTAGPR